MSTPASPARLDPDRYELRDFVDSDYEEMVRLFNLDEPDHPRTVGEFRAMERAVRLPHFTWVRHTVEDRRTHATVGVGALTQVPFNYHPQEFWIGIRVDPGHEGRGIGSALCEALERDARAHQATVLWSSVKNRRPRDLQFMERRGYPEVRRLWRSRLDLASAHPETLPGGSGELERMGLRIVTPTPEDLDDLAFWTKWYQLTSEAGADIPSVGTRRTPPFEEFRNFIEEFPGFYREANFFLTDGDRFVGVTNLERIENEPAALHVGFTGVLRQYRRQGLASILKRHSVEFARSHGFRYLITANDSTNERMWRINERLGFVVESMWIHGEKRLRPSVAEPPAP
jgi:mycothiol synthase